MSLRLGLLIGIISREWRGQELAPVLLPLTRTTCSTVFRQRSPLISATGRKWRKPELAPVLSPLIRTGSSSALGRIDLLIDAVRGKGRGQELIPILLLTGTAGFSTRRNIGHARFVNPSGLECGDGVPVAVLLNLAWRVCSTTSGMSGPVDLSGLKRCR